MEQLKTPKQKWGKTENENEEKTKNENEKKMTLISSFRVNSDFQLHKLTALLLKLRYYFTVKSVI